MLRDYTKDGKRRETTSSLTLTARLTLTDTLFSRAGVPVASQ